MIQYPFRPYYANCQRHYELFNIDSEVKFSMVTLYLDKSKVVSQQQQSALFFVFAVADERTASYLFRFHHRVSRFPCPRGAFDGGTAAMPSS